MCPGIARTATSGRAPLQGSRTRARMTRDPRGFRAKASAAAAAGRVLGDRRRVRSRSRSRSPSQHPGDDQRRALGRGGRGEVARGIGTDRCRPLPLVRLAQTGLRAPCSGWPPVAWSLEEWNNPATGVGAAFTIGLVGYAIAPAVVAHAVLAYPFGRLASRLERLTVVVAYVDTVLVLGLLPALFFAPAAHRVPSVPAKPAARRRQPGALRRSEQSWAVGYSWDGPPLRRAGARGDLLEPAARSAA